MKPADPFLLTTVDTQIEANMIAGKLRDSGIEAFLDSSVDYVGHVLSNRTGYNRVYVSSADQIKALEILKSTVQPSEVIELTAGRLLKRAVIMGALSFTLLPVVGNYYSIRNWFAYLRKETSPTAKIIWSMVIVGMQLLSFVCFYFFFRTWSP